MTMEINDIIELYQDIKHRGRKLSQEEISCFLNLIKVNFTIDNSLCISALLCLSLGSDYIENNPYYMKRFFDIKLEDEDVADLLKSIMYSMTVEYYINEVKKYIDICCYMNDYELSCFEAFYIFGAYLFNKKDCNGFKYLLDHFASIIKIYQQEVDEELKKEIKLYLIKNYKSLLFTCYGNHSYSFTFDIDKVIYMDNWGLELANNIPITWRV